MKTSKPNISDLADKVRRLLNYDANDPIDFSDLCSRNPNLTIVERPFSDKTSGMCIKNEPGSGIIAINSSMPLGRQHFTLAHELYHLYFTETPFIVCPDDESSSQNDEEKKANEFAMFFLMPNYGFYGYFEDMCGGALTIDTILKMEHYYQVSRRALLSKLCFLKLLDPVYKEQFLVNIVRTASEKGYPKNLYQSPCFAQSTTYGKYVALVNDLFSRGVISKQKRDELLLDAYRDDIVFPQPEGK